MTREARLWSWDFVLQGRTLRRLMSWRVVRWRWIAWVSWRVDFEALLPQQQPPCFTHFERPKQSAAKQKGVTMSDGFFSQDVIVCCLKDMNSIFDHFGNKTRGIFSLVESDTFRGWCGWTCGLSRLDQCCFVGMFCRGWPSVACLSNAQTLKSWKEIHSRYGTSCEPFEVNVVFNFSTQAKSHTHVSENQILKTNWLHFCWQDKLSPGLKAGHNWFWGSMSSWVLLQALILPRIADIMKEHRGKLKQLRPVCNL